MKKHLKKHLSIVAAAALAVGGMSMTARAQDAAEPVDNTNPLERAVERTGEAVESGAERTGEALNRAGEATKDALGIGEERRAEVGPAASAEEIHDVLAQVTEAALTRDGLDDMVERFVDADRNRLGQNDAVLDDNEAIDTLVAQLQQDWQARYNQEFDIGDEEKVYGGVAMIREGEIPDAAPGAAQPAGERIEADAERVGERTDLTGNVGGIAGEANVNTETGRADVNVDNNTGLDAPQVNTDGQTAADRNLNDPGRNIATVTFPASHGMPAVNVRMIHEAGGWKIDIPDHIDAMTLRQNVQDALSKASQHKDQWPADATEAYRGMTHKILLAVTGKPLSEQDAQKASDVQLPAFGQEPQQQPQQQFELQQPAPANPQ